MTHHNIINLYNVEKQTNIYKSLEDIISKQFSKTIKGCGNMCV